MVEQDWNLGLSREPSVPQLAIVVLALGTRGHVSLHAVGLGCSAAGPPRDVVWDWVPVVLWVPRQDEEFHLMSHHTGQLGGGLVGQGGCPLHLTDHPPGPGGDGVRGGQVGSVLTHRGSGSQLLDRVDICPLSPGAGSGRADCICRARGARGTCMCPEAVCARTRVTTYTHESVRLRGKGL